MTFRGHVSNGVVILPNSAGLPDGTLVDVIPLNERGAATPATALLAAMEKVPKIPREWVDELEQAIAAGQRSPSPPIAFTDEPASSEKG